MKVMAPMFTHEWEDEFDILLFAWFYRIGLKHGFRYHYQTYSDDCRIISQKFYLTPAYAFSDRLGTYRWMLFGAVSKDTFQFKWKREPAAASYELKSERAKQIWNYLMKLESQEELVQNAPRRLKAMKLKQYRLNAKERQQFKYYGSKMKDLDDDTEQ